MVVRIQITMCADLKKTHVKQKQKTKQTKGCTVGAGSRSLACKMNHRCAKAIRLSKKRIAEVSQLTQTERNTRPMSHRKNISKCESMHENLFPLAECSQYLRTPYATDRTG